MPRHSLRWLSIGVSALAASAFAAGPALASAHVRVNQVGYAPGAGKRAFLLSSETFKGRLIEFGPTEHVMTSPQDKRTEDYITGRFG